MSEETPRERDFTPFQSPHEASVNQLVQALDRAYYRPGLLLWRSFWQGFFTAIGAAVGTVVFVGLVSYLFSILGGSQLVKPYLDKLQNGLIQRQIQTVQSLEPTADPQLKP